MLMTKIPSERALEEGALDFCWADNYVPKRLILLN